MSRKQKKRKLTDKLLNDILNRICKINTDIISMRADINQIKGALKDDR